MASSGSTSTSSWGGIILAHISKAKSATTYASQISYNPIIPSVGHTRVLHVEAGELNEQIRCSLRQTPLDETHPQAVVYEALSYTWGDPKPAHKILLDGMEVGVPANLHAALRRFRNEHEKNSGVIWIDFLCINQEDTDGKNAQVAMMRQVYEQAHRVVVWLGGDSKDGDIAYHFLYEATVYMNNAYQEEWLIRAVDATYNEKRWRALSRFFDREYWTRIWIVQEVVSEGLVDVWWGEKHVLSWQEFAALGSMMYTYQSSMSQKPA
ncbi:heterokaryon incompatibility protein-domain-containing protein [Rhexocercosporidium sp. MPI-PUGE-AT-0058]|nr:heterokaryon incompatibility protein-domain-containing protein [Rhexocercosporidium sp. MPI-PUGE-AT-0058]